ncbi:histidine phosphatase family protein [Maribellus sp. YY47]|uniref:SixA phosphatase family protein n=1 Tax=Maribellus sp. YY47 TaxID=2929486 RepID=UPI00200174C0|nr:histidine phosphatase family protein [Maribellus sp. YY47]MCK3683389.1 histidine phosphatase family protein [Maribellus sp. YY47]
MKRVVIVRHGKAVPYGYDDDFNRDLQDRGKSDAALVSSELNRRKVTPDQIISSPAKRALKTARIFAENLGFDLNNIREVEAIYDGMTTGDFIDFIQELPGEAQTVFFFGHNPGFYYFAANLLRSFHGDMPTTSTVGIEFDIDDWKEVKARTGSLAFHLAPRMLK